jgi:hypothetical protein
MTDELTYSSTGAMGTQLNIVTTVDVAGLLAGRATEDCVWLTDTSPLSVGKGSSSLATTCTQGQVINWLILCLDTERRIDGSYPPIASVLSIVFLDGDSSMPSSFKVVDDLKTYGAPDRHISRYTPVYSYWAGMVPSDAPLGDFRYRLNIEIPSPTGGMSTIIEVAQPSLKIVG